MAEKPPKENEAPKETPKEDPTKETEGSKKAKRENIIGEIEPPDRSDPASVEKFFSEISKKLDEVLGLVKPKETPKPEPKPEPVVDDKQKSKKGGWLDYELF